MLVLHTQRPHCIIEFLPGSEIRIVKLFEISATESDLTALMKAAEEWFSGDS